MVPSALSMDTGYRLGAKEPPTLQLSLNNIPTSLDSIDGIVQKLMPSLDALDRAKLANAIRDKQAATASESVTVGMHPIPQTVIVQLYGTEYTARIAPSTVYSQFRQSVKDTFARHLSSDDVEFTLHYYPINRYRDPLSKVKFDHDDESVQNERWLDYLSIHSHLTIVLFRFKKDEKDKDERTPLRTRMQKQMCVNIPIPTAVASTDSPTEAAKANKRDDGTCVMCGDPSVPYVNRIVPDNEWWFKHVDVDLAVPHDIVWFIEKSINMITLCDDCQELFNVKAALWVEVDEKLKEEDPSRRLKLVLQDRIPEATDELSKHWKSKFPAGERFVRVPKDSKERARFPCWSTYDALWQWRLEWSKQKYAVLCKKEDAQRQVLLNAPIVQSLASSRQSHRRTKRKKEADV